MHDLIEEILEEIEHQGDDKLNSFEIDFMSSMQYLALEVKITNKQENVLLKIREKLGIK